MYLYDIIFLLALFALALGGVFKFAGVRGREVVRRGKGGVLAAGIIGASLALSMGLIFATRSPEFGVDTITYVELFAAYCRGYELKGYGQSFELSMLLLNAAMLGSCTPALVPMAWAIVMVGFLLMVPCRPDHRFAYIGLLLVSLIGLELLTNAMRQSFSIGMAVIAVALRDRNRPVALLAAACAVALHLSGSLILFATFGALFRWRLFLAGMMVSIMVIAVSLAFGSVVFFLEPLLYEIEKYLGHESDEIWVRVLAAACVLVVLGAPLAAAQAGDWRSVFQDRSYQIALRLGFACIPFIFIPWFGYRFIYGVFPLILWLGIEAVGRRPEMFARFFGWALAGNLLILGVWSNGSSYMRLVPVYA